MLHHLTKLATLWRVTIPGQLFRQLATKRSKKITDQYLPSNYDFILSWLLLVKINSYIFVFQ